MDNIQVGIRFRPLLERYASCRQEGPLQWMRSPCSSHRERGSDSCWVIEGNHVSQRASASQQAAQTYCFGESGLPACGREPSGPCLPPQTMSLQNTPTHKSCTPHWSNLPSSLLWKASTVLSACETYLSLTLLPSLYLLLPPSLHRNHICLWADLQW